MSITKCLDCERRIDIDIEDAHYVNDFECLCDDCNENEGDSMNILDDILNDKNVNGNLKKVMKGEPIKPIIIDGRYDSPAVQKAKLIAMDVRHMIELKQAILWWDEDEEKFVEKYGCSSDSLHEGDQINKDNLLK